MKITPKNGTVNIVTDIVEAHSLYLTPSFEFSEAGSINVSFVIPKMEFTGSELEGALKAMMQMAEQEAIKKYPKQKNQLTAVQPWEDEVDDNGDPTGRVLIKTKQKAKYTDKDGKVRDRVLKVVDSKGNDASGKSYTKGTKMRLSFTLINWVMASSKTYSCSRWLQSIQIIDPVFYEEGGGNEFGECEGYVAEPVKSAAEIEKQLILDNINNSDVPAEIAPADPLDIFDELEKIDSRS